MPLSTEITRRYQITSVLGQGGFGTVYRATLRGGSGFKKDVAIKLLKDPNPPAEVLERFRDEARVLGLIRDRAVVHVEPPVKLADRWAVVMEYVDGASLSRILRAEGPMPPEIAIEITAEIARALHRLWHQHGPEGVPLNLRHRDLKPSNIQVTPDGTIVLLDFGIAKATFESREARTATGVVGTEGYIAPERFFGTEGPTTDVFSLGVVLHEMITGKRPSPGGRIPTGTDLTSGALRLATRMFSMDPGDRPEPRDVERECSELIKAAGKHREMREWAERAVPAASRLEPDALVGEVLTEASTIHVADSGMRPLGLALFAGGTTALIAALVIAGLAVVVAVGVVAYVVGGRADVPNPVVTVVTAPPVAVVPVEVDAVEPADLDAQPPERSPTPRVEPRRTAPARPTAPSPVVESAATEPPAPAAATVPVSFGSLPPDAAVTVDGVEIGTTPIVHHALTQGTHRVVLVLDDRRVERTITVDRRAPSRYMWRVDGDAWEGSR